MAQSTAHIVSQLLQQHYEKSDYKRSGARKLMESGILRDYLNEKSSSKDIIEGFDSTLTWATPSNFKDRLLILDCASAATLLPDDEPDQLAWRSIKVTPTVETIKLQKHPTLGFGFSLVTIGGGVFVRRVQQHSMIYGLGKLEEGDKVLSVAGSPVDRGLTQKEIISILKTMKEVVLVVCHSKFDGKGTPETTYDRESPNKEQSPALESSYRLALDLPISTSPSKTSSKTSSSPRSTISRLSDVNKSYHSTSMGITGCNDCLRGDVRAAKHSYRNKGSTGSIGDTASTSSIECPRSSSSDGSDPYRTPLSSPYPAGERRKIYDRSSMNSSVSSHSSVRDFCLESCDSISSVQSLGSTEYIVLPNNGRGIGIGISGKNGVIIRNILPNSIAEKDGRLQIGDHILAVNNVRCANMNQKEAKDIVIPTLRNSTPTVKLVVQHVTNRARKFTNSGSISTPPSPHKSGTRSTLPAKKSSEQPGDLLLPEAMWSDQHPSGPVAYRFGTVVLPAPAWIRWSDRYHHVTLTRLVSGYGFSIMDYKEPKSRNEGSSSVLIIRQITPFGAADLEGHLGLGERIVSVNEELITSHTIEDIVSLIKPCSVLQLKMCKPVETAEWKELLNTNISSIPLVSGPRNTNHSNENSSSTLQLSSYTESQHCQSSESFDLSSLKSYGTDGSRFRYQAGSCKTAARNNNTLTRHSSYQSYQQSGRPNNSERSNVLERSNGLERSNTSDQRSNLYQIERSNQQQIERSNQQQLERSNQQRFTSSSHSYQPQRLYEPQPQRLYEPQPPTEYNYSNSYDRPSLRKNFYKDEITNSNTELESIISSVSLNNGELTEVWRRRIHQTSGPLQSQLSRV